MSPFVSIFSALSASICRVRWYRLGACYSRQRRLRTLVARPGTHAWSMCAQRATRCGFIIARRPEMRKCLYTITRQCRLSEYSVLSHCIGPGSSAVRERTRHTLKARGRAGGHPTATPSPRGVGPPWGPAGSATRRAHARRARGGQPVGGARDRSDLHRRSCGARSTRGSVALRPNAPTFTPGPEAPLALRPPRRRRRSRPPPPAAGATGREPAQPRARSGRRGGAAAFSCAFCRRSDEVDRHVRRVVAVRCCRKIMIIDQ